MGKVIGIDCGTGNQCVSVFENGSPVVISNSEGKRTTPSVVGFTEEGERKVGESGKRQAITNAKNTVTSIKRIIGRSYEEIKEEKTTYVLKNKNGKPVIDIYGRDYTPQEITAIILQKMKKTAEDYLGEKVTDAVITVPARFSQDQRQATKEAGEIAGLNVLRIVNEPTAAALAYGLDKEDKDMKIAVFDSGQGTFDISILEFGGGVFEVLSTNGDDRLGGDDFDKVIIDWIVELINKREGVNISTDPMAMQRLKEAAEKAKIELSSTTQTEINLPYITVVDGIPKHFVETLTRAKFEQISSKIIEKHRKPCIEALNAAEVNASDIDEVILVGGTTRIPAIQQLVKEVFGKEPSKSVNPDEAVSIGACIQGAILNQEKGVGDIVLLDVTPLNLGIETINNTFTTLIEANTTIPTKKSQIFTTAADNQNAITVRIAQGNRALFSDNKLLGQFNLDNIPPARRGVPQIEITVDIDASSLVTVSAKDLGTGKEQHITIQNNNLTQEEIDRMKREAEEHAAEDEKVKEHQKKLNEVDSTIYQVENFVEDYKDKSDILTEEDKTYFNQKIEELKTIRDGDLTNVDNLITEVNQRLASVGSKVYGTQNNQNGNPFGQGNFDASQFADMFGGKNGQFNGATNNGATTNTKTEDVEEV